MQNCHAQPGHAGSAAFDTTGLFEPVVNRELRMQTAKAEVCRADAGQRVEVGFCCIRPATKKKLETKIELFIRLCPDGSIEFPPGSVKKGVRN